MSRKATQLAMGPWFVRDEGKPFMPGFSAEVLRHQVMGGRIKPETPVRGPTTHQFWMPAIKTPGVSRLLGKCHDCAAAVAPHAKRCPKCDADLALPDEVDHLGLEFVSPEARVQAQQEIADGRRSAPPKPAPALKCSTGTGIAAAATTGPAAQTPATDTGPATTDESGAGLINYGHDEHLQEDDTARDSAEDDIEALWSAAPARPRRVKRSGPDPLLVGIGAVAVIGVLVAAYFAFTAASAKHEEKFAQETGEGGTAQPEPEPQPARPAPQRSAEDVDALADRVMPVMDQLGQMRPPAAFADDYEALRALVDQARSSREAGDLNHAYMLFLEADREAGALDLAVAEHLAEMDERGHAQVMREAAYASRQQALADDAQRWAPRDWELAEEAMANGEAAMTSDQPGAALDAQDAFRQASSDFEYARSQASLGFLAVQAGEKLDDAVSGSFTTQELQAFGGEAYREMTTLRQRGQEHLAEFEYYDALDSYEIAMLRLDQAERGVKRAHGVKFYAFAAGYTATDTLIAIAAGDGLSDEKREILRDTFNDLTLRADLVSALPDGDTPDYAGCAQVLVGQARAAITDELGLAAQLSYSVGFQFRIVQQTLDNPQLSAAHRTRINRTLRLIEEQAGQAGYDTRALGERLGAFQVALRDAQSEQGLDRARAAWRDIIVLLRNYERAMPIVNPAVGTAPDPELFPDAGTN